MPCTHPPRSTSMTLFVSKPKKSRVTVKHIENVEEIELEVGPNSSGTNISTARDRAVEAKLLNPFAGMTTQNMVDAGERFAKEHDLSHLSEQFKKAALLARLAISENPYGFEEMDLSEEDKMYLRRELEHKWDQPRELYYLVILCSIAAAVQGVSPASVLGLHANDLLTYHG
jgi:hypothetical protein